MQDRWSAARKPKPRRIISPLCRKPLRGFQPPTYACRTNRRTSDLCLLRQTEDGTPNGVSVMAISSRTANRQFRQHWRRRLRGLRLNNQTAHDHYAVMSEAATRIPTSNSCLSHQPADSNLQLVPVAANGGWNPQRGFRHNNFKPDHEPAVPPAWAPSISRPEAEQPNRARSLRRHVGSRCADSDLQLMFVAPTGGFQPPTYACCANRRMEPPTGFQS
jgi:hypothetical protein